MRKPIYERLIASAALWLALAIFGASIGITWYWWNSPGKPELPSWIQASAALFSASAVALVARSLFQEARRERREVSAAAWADLYRLLDVHKDFLSRIQVIDSHLARAAGCEAFGPDAFACVKSYLENYGGNLTGRFWNCYKAPLENYLELFLSICDQKDLISIAEEESFVKKSQERSVLVRVQNLIQSATTVDQRAVINRYVAEQLGSTSVSGKRKTELERIQCLLNASPFAQ